MQDRSIYTTDDVLLMLDALLEDSDADWNECFADRSRPCPFFVEWPDENLVAWFGQGQLTPGRVLELGCGHGRNATYLAGLGCGVDAVDLALLPTLIGLVVNLVIARSRRAAGAPALAWSPATAAPATRRRGWSTRASQDPLATLSVVLLVVLALAMLAAPALAATAIEYGLIAS